jgi:ferredoxin-NADP reductase/ferredoxin
MLTSIFQQRRRTNFSVRLQDGTAFFVQTGETLLEAALRSGLRAPHSCRVGACTTCRCRIVGGTAKSLTDRAYVLQPQEIEEGVFLACQTLPASDLVVDWEMQREAPPEHAATIVGLRQLTPRVSRVSISVDTTFQALPGQYVNITMEPVPGAPLARPFSLVSVAVARGRTVLGVDVAGRAGGASSWLTSDAAAGAGVRIEGPFGDCVAREGLFPLIAVGAGSGIGAASGALLYSHRRWPMRPTALLAYGGQTQDIYGLDEVADSAGAAGVPHLSRAWVEQSTAVTADISVGRAPTGLAAALFEAAAMSRVARNTDRDCEVLLYGPPGFVDCCIELLAGCGVSAERIRYDRYQPYRATCSAASAGQS